MESETTMAKSTNNNASQWLSSKGIVLEETFIAALQNYAKGYQKEHSIKQLDEIYRLIGTNKSHISYWKNHPHSTQTKNF